jgi:ATP-dependent DNA helicase RecG
VAIISSQLCQSPHIITLFKIQNGLLQNLNAEIVGQLEKMGLIVKVSGHTSKHTLSKEYQDLANKELTIGNYIVKEVELLLVTMQGNKLKMGDLETLLSESLNRNQLKYITTKLFDDKVLSRDGKASGTTYQIEMRFNHLRGNELVNKVIEYLRSKQEE